MSDSPHEGARRLGMVGCGRIVERGYLPAIATLPGVELAGLTDPDPARRRAVAAAAGDVREHRSVEELLAAGGIDALVVASPPRAHEAAAALAATAGIPCLVEKPPAESAEAARRMSALDPSPAIGFNRRYSLGAGLAEAAAAAVAPGSAPLELDLQITYRRRSWDAVGEPDEAWLDLAPHLIDLALLAAGPELRVDTARIGADRFAVELYGERLRARLRGHTDRAHRERVRLRDGEGRTIYRADAGGVAGLLRRRGPHPLVASLRDQLLDWVASSPSADPGSSNGSRLASADDGVRVMEILEAARVAARPTAVPF